MQYTEGRIGRVFSLRIDDGEDILEELTRFAGETGIACGMVQVLGALRDGRIVTGPEEPVFPPVPHLERVEGGWEVVGTGTIYPGEGVRPSTSMSRPGGARRRGRGVSGSVRRSTSSSRRWSSSSSA